MQWRHAHWTLSPPLAALAAPSVFGLLEPPLEESKANQELLGSAGDHSPAAAPLIRCSANAAVCSEWLSASRRQLAYRRKEKVAIFKGIKLDRALSII